MPRIRRVQGVCGSRTTRRDLRDLAHLRVLLAGALNENSSCIDVGANVGGVLSEIVRVAPAGRHIAYEPIPELADSLAQRFPGVDVRQAALSDAAGQTTFEHVRDRPGLSRLRPNGTSRGRGELIEVRTERLDASLPEDYVPALIKIDVEGAERLVLEGSIETISRHRPIVVFEHGAEDAPNFDTGPDQVFELLTDRPKLRIFDLDGNGPYARAEFAATFAAARRWNFIAAP